jgi:hypothetical protein
MSVENLETDLDEQCNMATKIIEYIGAEKVRLVRGTPAHVGFAEDWEDQIAKNVGAPQPQDEALFGINGVVFFFKHHTSNRKDPHNRGGQLAKNRVQQVFNSLENMYERAEVVVYSHVHYFSFMGGTSGGDWVGITTPALMGYGPKYARKYSGSVDFGFVVFDIVDPDDWSYTPVLMKRNENELYIPTEIL